MLPFRQTDTTFAELGAELGLLTGGVARFTIDHDQEPFPAAWSDGAPRLVVGTVQTSFRGVVVLVELQGESPAELDPWEFDERFSEPIARLLAERLPRRLVWRLEFSNPAPDGPRRLSLAHLNRCRLGAALVRPSRCPQIVSTQESAMHHSQPPQSLLDELHHFFSELLATTYHVSLDPSAREANKHKLAQFLLQLRLRSPRIIDDEYIGRLEARLDGLTHAVERLQVHQPDHALGSTS